MQKPNSKMAECKNFKVAREFLLKRKWPMKLSDSRFDKCYCQTCYPSNLRDTYVVGGKTYVVPRGYTRIGVKIDEAYADHLNIWEDWVNCFHGTSIEAAKSIIEHRMLLLPGDETIDGKEIKIRPGHFEGEVAFFTTPTIKYASLPAYASKEEFVSSSDKGFYNITVVLQCKQKPDSFVVQGETIGAGARKLCKFIPNSQMEWRTKQRASIIPYGMLLLVEPVRNPLEGVRIRCPSVKTKAFRLPKGATITWEQVMCPHCHHTQDWINPEFNQGKILQCTFKSCNVKFKPYTCPHCANTHTVCKCFQRFSDETVFPCVKCDIDLMSTHCPHCKASHNFSKLPDDLNQVVWVDCNNKLCNKKRYIVSECPHCQELKNIKATVGNEGVVVSCPSKRGCSKKYQLVPCPKCLKVCAFPNAYSKCGRDDMVACAYHCGAKFRQPLQPRVTPTKADMCKTPKAKATPKPMVHRKRTNSIAPQANYPPHTPKYQLKI